MSFCSTCGNRLTPGAAFCPNCGSAVERPTASAPERPVLQGPTAPAPGGRIVSAHPSEAPTSTTAVISLTMGVASYFVLPILGAIAAIVCGHIARGEIRRSGGRVTGNGLALAGLVLGYAHFVLLCLALVVAMFVLSGGLAALLVSGPG